MLIFRPHHFLCALSFSGKGYSKKFINNFSGIINEIFSKEGDKTLIKVKSGLDSICGPCPNHNNSTCKQKTFTDELDKRHAKILELTEGQELTWGEAKTRMRKNMTLPAFHFSCEQCIWKKTGKCENSLKMLHNNTLPQVRKIDKLS